MLIDREISDTQADQMRVARWSEDLEALGLGQGLAVETWNAIATIRREEETE